MQTQPDIQRRLSLFHLLPLIAFFLFGCGGSGDHHVLVDDAKKLKPGSKVVWRGTEVGEVVGVEPQEGKLRIDVEFASSYREEIREGVSAKPENGILTKFTPVLQLYGGNDSSRPALAGGAEIPLDRSLLPGVSTGSFLSPPVLTVAGLLLIALILLLAWKGVKKLIAFVLVVVFFCAGMWICREQWNKYRDVVVSPALEAKWNDFANATFRSPEAVDAWEAVKRDSAELLDKAEAQGGEALKKAREKTVENLDAQIEKLKSQGKEDIAAELSTLKNQIISSKEGED